MSLTLVVRAFVEADDAARHVVRGQPRKAEYDGDDRNVDAREDIDGRAKGSANPEEQDQHCHDDKSVGAPQRDLHDADHGLLRTHQRAEKVPSLGEARS